MGTDNILPAILHGGISSKVPWGALGNGTNNAMKPGSMGEVGMVVVDGMVVCHVPPVDPDEDMGNAWVVLQHPGLN